MTQAVRIERQGAVATVILERPAARNAVDPATAERLADAFLEIERDGALAASVLWGADGTFCAGADTTTSLPPSAFETGLFPPIMQLSM
jgi:enoyl-CoA hydratase